MKILFFVNTKLDLSDKFISGGIESLNVDLYNHFKKINKFTILTNKITNKIVKIRWDVIVSSNDARVFNKTISKRKILWLHNKLQIEKSFRKKQFFPILKNKIEAFFVSQYLENNTSYFYCFYKRIIISNFLLKIFAQKKITYKSYSKKIFVWSVQREKGLDYVLNLWVNKIHPYCPRAEFHIFSIYNKNAKYFENYKIFFHGRVSRLKLIHYYKKSIGMICLGYDETFCLNALESMSLGVPVISLGQTALSKLLKNNKNGYKIKNIFQLEGAIKKLINLNNVERKQLIKTTIKFTEKYQADRIFKVWEKLLLN